MKITLYTIADDKSAFCKDVKAYLTSKSLPFDEKRVDQDREALSAMLTVSNNFAGVPFTVIEKDDGQKVMLKGFTQPEFDTALTTEAAKAGEPTKPQSAGTSTPVNQNVQQAKQAVQAGQPPSSNQQTTTNLQDPKSSDGIKVNQTTSDGIKVNQTTNKAQEELDGILNDLKSKGGVDLGVQPTQTPQTPPAPQAPQEPVTPAVPQMPQVPLTPEKPKEPIPQTPPAPQGPKIPDFPAK